MRDSNQRYSYLAIVFWTGFAALIYQMYSVRVLFMFFVENTHAVAIAISSFLGGLAFSSLIFSKLAKQKNHDLYIIRCMLLAAGIYTYIMLVNYQWIPEWLDSIHSEITVPWVMTTLKYAIMFVYLFIPAFFLGGIFPLANDLYLQHTEKSRSQTSTVYFYDTFGAILGALAAGFILLPLLGIRATVSIAAAINLLTVMVMMPERKQSYIIAACLFVITTSESIHYINIREVHFTVSRTGNIVPVVDMDNSFGQVLFQKESPFGRITVGITDGIKVLFVNYRSMCDTRGISELTLAETTMQQTKGGDVLNIGLGCGLTASKLALHNKTKSLDIVEINPVMPEAARFFSRENHNVLDLPNVNLHIENGTDWVRRNSSKKYDAILVDIEEVTVIYSLPLYTKEYFSIIHDRLNSGGVFALWSFRVGPEFTKVMYNTLKEAFPYVEMQFHRESAVTYYAAMHPLKLNHYPDGEADEVKKFAASVKTSNNSEINTLENHALEKYYNSNSNFNLPDYYREDFARH